MGARRQAFYANLGPSTYRFTVNVSDGRGIWTESSASASFEIMPTFVQTKTFLYLCAGAAFGILALLYQARCQATGDFKECAKERKASAMYSRSAVDLVPGPRSSCSFLKR